MIIECKCGAEGYYDERVTQCPNDIIDQNPEWEQDENGEWICNLCKEERDNKMNMKK